MRQFEDCIFQTNDSMEKNTQYIDLMKKEIYTLKEERTELLTRLHRLKEEKIALQNELKEAIEEINVSNGAGFCLLTRRVFFDDAFPCVRSELTAD